MLPGNLPTAPVTTPTRRSLTHTVMPSTVTLRRKKRMKRVKRRIYLSSVGSVWSVGTTYGSMAVQAGNENCTGNKTKRLYSVPW